jgi:glycosyltransferase involved in cell wall biosynthesis
VERELRGQKASRFARWADHLLWAHADRLWVVSENLGRIVADSGINPARIQHISLGVPTEQFEPVSPDKTGSVTNIALVSSFHPWHGVATLLDAFKSALQCDVSAKLILIGDGVTRADNQRQAEELGISEHVEFTGWLPLDEVAERLKTVDIAVAPYDRLKNFHFDPVKILEYMAMGLPVIASDQGEVPTMLDQGRCGILVPPGEFEPLANEIARLSKDPELRHDLGKAARRRVEEHYDWSVTVQQVIALCCEAIKPTSNNF